MDEMLNAAASILNPKYEFQDITQDFFESIKGKII